MKTKIQYLLIALTLLASLPRAFAQAVDDANTAMVYQGLLSRQTNDIGNHAYDLTFTLFNTSSGGSPVAGPITNTAVAVNSNGLFLATMDFGSSVFNGSTNWLEISVRTNGGSAFTTLAPRQLLTSTPQSIYALSAGTAAIATTATNFVGTVSGDVSGPQGATVVASVGGQTAANIAAGVIAANSATSSNLPNTIVARDSNGNISAGTLFTGITGTPNVPVLPVSGSVVMAGNLYLPFPAIIYSGTNTMMIEEGNIFLGQAAGGSAPLGYTDVGIGDFAMNHLTTGSYNTGVGESNLFFNTTGSYNTAIGEQALFNNTTGSNNTAGGFQALHSNTTGYNNKADGYQALYSNTTGYENTAIGYQAMFTNTNGYQNAANGGESLYNNTSGYWNTANGVQALYQNTSGAGNTANGFQALYANTIGFQNTADGVWSLLRNTNGISNTAIGYDSLQLNTSGTLNTAEGAHALINNTSGSNNIAIGGNAGDNLTTGNNNIDIGNEGVTGEGNTIRVGTTNIQTRAYVAGIWGTTLGSNMMSVVVDSSGHLGASATAASMTLSLPPTPPTSALSSVGTGNNPEGMALAGRYVYVVNGGGTLQIFDVNTPSNPVLISTTPVLESSLLYSVAVAGRYAYVLTYDGTLQVFDVSDPAAPLGLGTVSAPHPGSLTVAGRYVYVIGSGTPGTLQIFDVDNPNSPVSVGSVAASNPEGVTVSGRYAYVVNSGTNMLQIFDVSTPSSPTWTGTYTGTNGAGTSVAVSGRYAYLTAGTTLQIIDVSNPGNPTLVPGSTLTISSSPSSITVADGYAYMVDYSSSGSLVIVNVSNPASPSILPSPVATGSFPDELAVSGRYAYVAAEYGNTLQVFDLGGAYIQQLEAGSTETGTLQVRDNATVGNNLDVRGGLTVSASARIAGGLSVYMPGPTDTTNGSVTTYIADFSVSNSPVTFVSTLDNNGNWIATSFYPSSDRNAKENFKSVSPGEMLDKVAALPISRWNYKVDKGSAHIGPMAQDFYSAFSVGMDDKHIATVDEEGVALAAIQGLNQKLNEKDAEIEQLKQRLDRLETLISSSTDKQNGGVQ